MNFLPELRHLLLLLLVLSIQVLIVPVQMIKIICLLLQLLVNLSASAVFPVFLLSEFLLEPFNLCFRHSSQLFLLLQHFFFLLLKPVISLVSLLQILFCPTEIINSLPLFVFCRFLQVTFLGS